MGNRHGDFVWYELMTDDAAAARRFYSGLVGWDIETSASGETDYRMISSGRGPIAGLMPLTAEMQQGGARPMWAGYIMVDDVDDSAAAIEAAGGTIHMPPWDIPGVGRAAFVADPQGAPIYIMRPTPPPDVADPQSDSFAASEPMEGHCAWNELASSDPAAAKTFYGDAFGWEQEGEMDMGPLGKYEFWKVGDERGHMLGAVMPLMPGMPASMWTFYFRVPDIDAAVAYTAANGGKALQEPTEIPGGEYSFSGLDPQGAAFGLVGPRKEN